MKVLPGITYTYKYTQIVFQTQGLTCRLHVFCLLAALRTKAHVQTVSRKHEYGKGDLVETS